MDLPKDPFMLLSTVNTLLRDDYDSLSELAQTLGTGEANLRDRLAEIGYQYDPKQNRFR